MLQANNDHSTQTTYHKDDPWKVFRELRGKPGCDRRLALEYLRQSRAI
jgi:hypothetical protein